MKLFRYNQFIGAESINETIDKAKKFLKDQYLIKKIATDLGFINDELDYDLRTGQKKALTSNDFSAEQFGEIRSKFRDNRLTDEQIRTIERNPDFEKIKTKLGQKYNGWVYSFTYFYFVEGLTFEELFDSKDINGNPNDLFSRLLELSGLLDRLPKKFDHNFIDETIPSPDNNHTNSELLSDELDKLEEYRKVKKIIDTLPSKLKSAANRATALQMEQLVEIANGFENVEESKKDLVWRTFFGELLEDTNELTRDGKPNPTFGKMVWRSRLFRFTQLDNPLVEFIKAAKKHLESSSSEGYSDRVQKINKVNDTFGVKGCRVVFDEAGIMIVEVNSYFANRELNSHCSHCIVNTESYWKSYLGDYNIQYYIYNFNLGSTDVYWTIGVTIKPDRTYTSGACQTVNNRYIGSEFKSLLKKWEKEYGIDHDLWDILRPLSQEEIDRRKAAQEAERSIVKKMITDQETGRERPITAEDIRKFVRENGADVNRDSGKALINAVEDDDYERVKTILTLGGSPNLLKGSSSAISKAKDLEMIKLLVSYHAVLTGDVFNNIVCDKEALEFCLKAGADPNFNSNLPIRKVAKGSWQSLSDIGKSHFDGYLMLMKYGAKTEEAGKNFVIKWAAEYGRMDIIEDQIGRGCKTGFVDAYSWLGHTRRLPQETKEKVGIFLKEKSEKFEKADWDLLVDKLSKRNKSPWI